VRDLYAAYFKKATTVVEERLPCRCSELRGKWW